MWPAFTVSLLEEVRVCVCKQSACQHSTKCRGPGRCVWGGGWSFSHDSMLCRQLQYTLLPAVPCCHTLPAVAAAVTRHWCACQHCPGACWLLCCRQVAVEQGAEALMVAAGAGAPYRRLGSLMCRGS